MADRSVWRACGCRGTDGKQLGEHCPQLTSDPKHGTWRYRVSGGKDPRTGKRRQVFKAGFLTRQAAEKARNKVRSELDTGSYRDDDKMTLAAWLDQWIDKKEVGGNLRPSTLRMYRAYIRYDIAPAIGRLRLSEVHPQHVDNLLGSLLAAGRGAVTVRRIHATLSSALTSARRLRMIAVNPAADVELPEASRPKVHPWEPAQLSKFLGVSANHRLSALFEVAAFTGLRRGELAGLRWADVDLAAQVITVRTQIVQTGNVRIEGKPKTRSGEDRRIDIGGRVVGALLSHQFAQQIEQEAWGSAYQNNDRVFCREDGSDLSPDNVSRIFRALVHKAKLRPIHLHDLRHGAASLMLASGTDIAVVSKRLGHSTISLTSDTYGHLIGGVGRRAADAAEKIVPTAVQTMHTPKELK